jgi:hypothetical protein
MEGEISEERKGHRLLGITSEEQIVEEAERMTASRGEVPLERCHEPWVMASST